MIEAFNTTSKKIPAELDDYVIYATILTHRELRGLSKTPLIRQRTFTMDALSVWTDKEGLEPVRRLLGEVPGLLGETIDNFIEKNRLPIDLKPIPMGFPYRLLPESERQQLFGITAGIEAGYQKLRRDFPDSHGLISLSRVGFDRDRRQSIVAFGHQFGGRSGHGHYIFLEPRDGLWHVIWSTRGWVS
jgi:hypothetical protein